MSGGANDGPAASGAFDPIVEAVLRAVLAGVLRPGQRLPERWIVETCGCTQSAARESIGRLQSLGAVVVPERRGASVISGREAPLSEVDRVWRQLLPLLEAPAGARLCSAEGALWERLSREQAALEAARPAAGDRLTDLLKRVSLQRAILGMA
ncbi:GntR family transcriptional regulator [Phenylobacterium sp.]|uniref:GntR family transcriptional regulator n=1 Tax=Phenylobacterium sp. TaxID=1871053 RepID=UPI0035B1FB2C